MAIKLLRKKEIEKEKIKGCFVEAKQKKALVTMCSCFAEMKISENGEDVYLYCEWMDQEPDEIYFEATAEGIGQFLTFERNDIEKLEELREELLDECFDAEEALESRFKNEYSELMDVVSELLKEKGYDTEFID